MSVGAGTDGSSLEPAHHRA